jgi:uncharacterized membrane protein
VIEVRPAEAAREERPPFGKFRPFFSPAGLFFVETILGTTFVRSTFLLLTTGAFVFFANAAAGQNTTPSTQTPKSTTAKPAAKPAQTPPGQDTVASPVSRHYPILIIAHGTEPSWSLKLGMKGPQRLDRVGYPPIILDPADIVADDTGNSWTYNAKDDATGANVAVKLTREACSDAMSDTKYTFRVEVDHAQIGQLKGCGQSSPDKFPEFLKKNQPDAPDDMKDPKDKEKDKDKEKKAVLDPITGFHTPVVTAYLDATGKLILSRGEVKKTVAASAMEPALSHDGKLLLYTKSDSKTGPERSIVLYEADTGRSREIAGTNVRQAFWSPDDTKIAYLKFDGKIWQVWIAPVSAPDKTTLLSAMSVDSLHGWVNPTTVLASDMQNLYWISEDKPSQTVPLKEVYGESFQIMSSDTIRMNPVNPDILLVSAYYLNAPPGAPTDQAGLNQTFFLYELRSHRRTILGPTDMFSKNAEWSRDGLQIFFTRGVPGKGALATDRMFWDSTGERRFMAGNNLVVGK